MVTTILGAVVQPHLHIQTQRIGLLTIFSVLPRVFGLNIVLDLSLIFLINSFGSLLFKQLDDGGISGLQLNLFKKWVCFLCDLSWECRE